MCRPRVGTWLDPVDMEYVVKGELSDDTKWTDMMTSVYITSEILTIYLLCLYLIAGCMSIRVHITCGILLWAEL